MSESETVKRWPGETDEAHPELCNTIPPQPATLKPGQLTREQVEQFFDQGFLLLDSFFTPEELDPAKDAVNALVDELAQKLYDGGKIKDLYKDLGYHQRLTQLDKEFPGANILMHKLGHLPPAFQNVWSNERLLNVAEQFLGTSDISGHPVWNLRTKIPRADAATVPWHQDVGYLDNDSYKVFQLTAWIPLMDSDMKNGCMQVVRNGHKTGKVARHVGCWKDTWYVILEEEEMRKTLGCDLEKDVVLCPVPYGGLLLFSNFLPHRSLDNTSDRIRWSLDFRWQDSKKSPGFFGLKDPVQLRSSSDPNFKINWDKFANENRHTAQTAAVQAEEKDPFETLIPGPWMKKWELVNRNRHTDAMEKSGGDFTNWHSENLILG